MDFKILAILLFAVVILPIVFSSNSSKSKNNVTKSSESQKSGKSKNNATKTSESPKPGKSNQISKSKKKLKPRKRKPSKSKNNATKPSESPKTGKSNQMSKSKKKLKKSKRKPSKCSCKSKPKSKPTQNQRIFRGDVDEDAPYYQILIEIRGPINTKI